MTGLAEHILIWLRAARYSGPELGRKVGANARTVRRVIHDLQAAGFEIFSHNDKYYLVEHLTPETVKAAHEAVGKLRAHAKAERKTADRIERLISRVEQEALK